MCKIFKKIGISVGTVCLFFGLSPLVFGIVHTGVFALILLGGSSVALCHFWHFSDPLRRTRIRRSLRNVSDKRFLQIPRWWKWLRTICATGLIIIFIAGCALSVPMLRAAINSPGQEERTVIVLGCQIVDDQPSAMLHYRLNAAIRYLYAHPSAPVVVSGGQGNKEQYSEAAIMKKVLTEQGIAENRIYLEDQSTNTEENIRFSSQLITNNNLPVQTAIATDSFHQLRASIYAERNGISAASLTSKTPWGLLPSYWMREFFALAKAVVIF